MLITGTRALRGTKSPICFSQAGLFSTEVPKTSSGMKIPYNLLHFFDSEKTIKALNFVQDRYNPAYERNSKNFIILDKLSHNDYSETYRAFDTNQKKFFAVKTMSLTSTPSLKQLNLILRQHERNHPSLINFSYLNHNQFSKEVKIFSEIQKNILVNGVTLPKSWTNNELQALLLQILHQMNALKELGAYCHHITHENVFTTEDGKALRVYDFSGFEVEPEKVNPIRWYLAPHVNMDAAIMSLVQIIDPSVAVKNEDDARNYLKKKYPSFLQNLTEIQKKADKLYHLCGLRPFESVYKSYEKLSRITLFNPKEFDRLTLYKIKGILESYPDFDEKWANINIAFNQYDEAIPLFRKELDKQIEQHDELNENKFLKYLGLAEAFKGLGQAEQASEYFKKTINISYNVPNIDATAKARMYNEYGKLNRDQKRNLEALDCFQMAEKVLKESLVTHASLKSEIENNIKSVDSSPKMSFVDDFLHVKKQASKPYRPDFNAWALLFSRHNIPILEQFMSRMELFAQRMELFGKKMEYLGPLFNKYMPDWAENEVNSRNDLKDENNSQKQENNQKKQDSNSDSNKQAQSNHNTEQTQKESSKYNYHQGSNQNSNNWHSDSHNYYQSYNKNYKRGIFYRINKFTRSFNDTIYFSVWAFLIFKAWTIIIKPPEEKKEQEQTEENMNSNNYININSVLDSNLDSPTNQEAIVNKGQKGSWFLFSFVALMSTFGLAF